MRSTFTPVAFAALIAFGLGVVVTLATHPAVADAAVFGVPNEDLAEEVRAVVQPMPGIRPTADFAE